MIDWHRVTTLRDEVGEEDFEEIVPMFLEEVSEITEQLSGDVDLDQLEANLHCLKGSAMNLGFADFSTLCNKGERMAATGNAPAVDVEQILASFESSKAVFLDGLSKGLPS